MKDYIAEKKLQFRYTLIDLGSYPSDIFLASRIPEEVLLAILADRNKDKEKRPVIQKILTKLHKLLKDNPGKLKEKLIQLETLGKLRSIQSNIIEEERNMALTYDLKTDIRYKQGRREERKANMEKTVRNLLLKTKFSAQKIADIAEAPITLVKTIKKQLA